MAAEYTLRSTDRSVLSCRQGRLLSYLSKATSGRSDFAFRCHAQPAPSSKARVYTRLSCQITRIGSYLHLLGSSILSTLVNHVPNDPEIYPTTGQAMFRYSGRHRIMGSSHRSGPRDDGFTKRRSQSGHYHRNCQLYGSKVITSNDLSWWSWLEEKRRLVVGLYLHCPQPLSVPRPRLYRSWINYHDPWL